jgi:uncharacterized membrane protein
MIRFENTIDIHCPIEKVFRFVADFENIPKWNYYVTQVRQATSGDADVGTIYHQVRKEDAQDFQIAAYQPYRMVAVRTIEGSAPAFARTFTFEEVNNNTRIVDIWELETGHNRLVEALGKGRISAAVADNLGKLKQLLETGETQLQDGRVSRL